ncbi:MAG: FtsX-like permease family protein, partial [Aureliella sp.]
ANRSKRVGIMGLEPNPQLFRLLNTNEQPIVIPEFGIMLNTRLADVLGVVPGDVLTVEVLEDKRPTLNLEVTKIVEEYSGANAYINKHQLHNLLKESSVASGAFLKVDSNRVNEIFHELKLRPGVGSVAIKDAVIDSFQATMEKSVLVMRTFIAGFAAIIAIGVVYNSARISLSERSRDLATMRVIGFSKHEVSTVLLAETALFTLLAIPLGWLIGFGLAALMVRGMDTDNYRIPLVINPSTLGMAALVVVVATLVSAMIVQRRINELDLIGVLKTRE